MKKYAFLFMFMLLFSIIAFAEESSWEYAYTHFNGGESYRNASSYSHAIEEYEKALVIFSKLKDKTGIANCMYWLGVCYAYLVQNNSAIGYYDQALELYEETNDKWRVVWPLIGLGIINRFDGKYPDALDYYNKSLEAAIETGNSNGEKLSYTFFEDLYTATGEFDKASDYRDKYNIITKEIAEVQKELDLASSYMDKKKYEDSILAFNKALGLAKEYNDKKAILTSLMGIGTGYYETGNFQESMKNNLEALEIAREIDFRIEEARILSLLGYLYYQLGQNDKALDYLKQASRKAVEGGTQIKDLEHNITRLEKGKPLNFSK